MTLQESMLSQELTNADLTKIAALQQKRTLAFVNHFVMTNVQFFNNFMRQCEQKLIQFEGKLEKVNAAMTLLETRLSSIPELNTTTPTDTAESTQRLTEENIMKDTTNTEKSSESKEPIVTEVESTETDSQTWPEYDRFVKMVQVGVPVQAVKLKLSLEGLDPNVFDEILKK